MLIIPHTPMSAAITHAVMRSNNNAGRNEAYLNNAYHTDTDLDNACCNKACLNNGCCTEAYLNDTNSISPIAVISPRRVSKGHAERLHPATISKNEAGTVGQTVFISKSLFSFMSIYVLKRYRRRKNFRLRSNSLKREYYVGLLGGKTSRG